MLPQGLILGPLLSLVYINDLKSNPKLFSDDASLFSVIHIVNLSQIDLNEDLDIINNWAYKSKMIFNPDLSNIAQEAIFSRKLLTIDQDVGQVRCQKHLVMFLDFKLSFNEHLENILAKKVMPYFANFNHCCQERLF